MNRFVIAEPDKCIGCRTCEIACVLAHPAEDGSKQTLTPDNFKPRLKLIKTLEVTAPVQCRHCVNAPCIDACPTEAIVYQDNTVQIIQELCIGCSNCVYACPFGVMEVIAIPAEPLDLGTPSNNDFDWKAHKCDLCIDVSTGPACITVCPTDALHLVESPDIDQMTVQHHDSPEAAARHSVSIK